MRREADFFDSRELILVYMARRLSDALRLEDLLTRSGVEYLVETGKYEGGLLFRRELTGAFFYIDPEVLEQTEALMLGARFKPYDQRENR